MTPAAAITELQEADKVLCASQPSPFPLPVAGLEALVAGCLLALERKDWWVPGLRERVGAVLRGAPIEQLKDGFSGARPYRVAPPSSSPAFRALTAVGLALAEPEQTTLVHLGAGSVSNGDFFEALNLAALHRPNIIFVVAMTELTQEAPVGPQLSTSPDMVASAFELPTVKVDGRDAKAVLKAVKNAKRKGGPHLIQAELSHG